MIPMIGKTAANSAMKEHKEGQPEVEFHQLDITDSISVCL